jgi:outer membrane protein, heavy metal efflux system
MLLGAGALCAGSVGAQSVLTPDDAVRRALASPVMIAALDADMVEAEAGLIEAGRWSNPMLTLDREAGEPVLGEPDETSITLSQTFSLGSRRSLERQAVRRGIDAAHAAIAVRRAELRAEVLRDYFAALVASRRLAALTTSVAAVERIDRIATMRRDAGDLSGFEQRRIAQHVERVRLQHDAAEADSALARAELAGRIGIDALTLHLPADLEIVPPSPGARAGDSAALDMLAARRAQAEAELAAARGWQVPLTLGVGHKRFDGAAGRDDALLLELAVALPLFDRNQAARQRAAAGWQRADAAYRLAAQRASTRRAAAAQQLQQRIDSAHRLQAALLPQARELARIAEASFAEGELDLPGLLAALDEELEATEQALTSALEARHAAIWFELMYPHTHAAGE